MKLRETRANSKYYWMAMKLQQIEELLGSNLTQEEIGDKLNELLIEHNQKPLAPSTVKFHCREIRRKTEQI